MQHWVACKATCGVAGEVQRASLMCTTNLEAVHLGHGGALEPADFWRNHRSVTQAIALKAGQEDEAFA
jgi:hypothetical protein